MSKLISALSGMMLTAFPPPKKRVTLTEWLTLGSTRIMLTAFTMATAASTALIPCWGLAP